MAHTQPSTQRKIAISSGMTRWQQHSKGDCINLQRTAIPTYRYSLRAVYSAFIYNPILAPDFVV
ncbi:hypothetical protein KCP77_15990 [Salmonella enterica subsp. enterica]|nr:hypothetical protein KCP77_15990 [Salmonella enterica subsp. enterica]